MPIAVENLPFIDVIGLSKLHCNKPILGDLKYATHENFVGRPIAGYHPSAHDICLLAPQAAQMLCQTQNYLLNEFGYGLIIFDAYRPLRAVTDFAEWFKKAPETSYELTRKEIHYPCYEKKQLPVLGYVAEKVSRHCFGRAVDLTLVDMNTEKFSTWVLVTIFLINYHMLAQLLLKSAMKHLPIVTFFLLQWKNSDFMCMRKNIGILIFIYKKSMSLLIERFTQS